MQRPYEKKNKNRIWTIAAIRKIVQAYRRAEWGKKSRVLELYDIGPSHIAYWQQVHDV